MIKTIPSVSAICQTTNKNPPKRRVHQPFHGVFSGWVAANISASEIVGGGEDSDMCTRV
jgi:hypothetical protein